MQSGTRAASGGAAQQRQGSSGSLSQTNSLFLHEDPWNILRLYHVYRLALAGTLLLAVVTNYSQRFASMDSDLFSWLTAIYLLVAIISNLTSYFEFPDLEFQGFFYLLIDIGILMSLLYASQGIGSGLGILLIIPILMLYICVPSHIALLIAASTGISVIALEVWLGTQLTYNSTSLTHSGILAFFILLSSWIGSHWIKKVSNVAHLAQRRGLDLANLSQLNRSILDRLESGIMVIEESGAIRHMNATAWTLLGEPGNWRSKPIKSFAPELAQHFHYWLNEISPKAAGYDIRHQRTTELQIRFSQLGTQSRQTTLVSLEDLSEQREKVQDVKLASLGQLTASIAHEIRNPLGAISHAAQLMTESQNLDKADLRLLQIIQSNARRMNLTIESVLNLSRKKEPSREPIKLKAWLNEFTRDFCLQNQLPDNKVTLFIEPADTTVDFDPAHLNQIIWNLCRNAVKYAHDTPTKLQLDIQGGTPSHTRDVLLNIIDNGKGIPEDLRQRLFEPFFTTSTKGTGLGLFMARELCLSNGANLEYIALPAGGSCFRIVFSRTNR